MNSAFPASIPWSNSWERMSREHERLFSLLNKAKYDSHGADFCPLTAERTRELTAKYGRKRNRLRSCGGANRDPVGTDREAHDPFAGSPAGFRDTSWIAAIDWAAEAAAEVLPEKKPRKVRPTHPGSPTSALIKVWKGGSPQARTPEWLEEFASELLRLKVYLPNRVPSTWTFAERVP